MTDKELERISDIIESCIPGKSSLETAKAIHAYHTEAVSKARHIDAYDTLNALEEISLDPDPIGATEGYIVAWKKHLSKLKAQLDKKGGGE